MARLNRQQLKSKAQQRTAASTQGQAQLTLDGTPITAAFPKVEDQEPKATSLKAPLLDESKNSGFGCGFPKPDEASKSAPASGSSSFEKAVQQSAFTFKSTKPNETLKPTPAFGSFLSSAKTDPLPKLTFGVTTSDTSKASTSFNFSETVNNKRKVLETSSSATVSNKRKASVTSDDAPSTKTFTFDQQPDNEMLFVSDYAQKLQNNAQEAWVDMEKLNKEKLAETQTEDAPAGSTTATDPFSDNDIFDDDDDFAKAILAALENNEEPENDDKPLFVSGYEQKLQDNAQKARADMEKMDKEKLAQKQTEDAPKLLASGSTNPVGSIAATNLVGSTAAANLVGSAAATNPAASTATTNPVAPTAVTNPVSSDNDFNEDDEFAKAILAARDSDVKPWLLEAKVVAVESPPAIPTPAIPAPAIPAPVIPAPAILTPAILAPAEQEESNVGMDISEDPASPSMEPMDEDVLPLIDDPNSVEMMICAGEVERHLNDDAMSLSNDGPNMTEIPVFYGNKDDDTMSLCDEGPTVPEIPTKSESRLDGDVMSFCDYNSAALEKAGGKKLYPDDDPMSVCEEGPTILDMPNLADVNAVVVENTPTISMTVQEEPFSDHNMDYLFEEVLNAPDMPNPVESNAVITGSPATIQMPTEKETSHSDMLYSLDVVPAVPDMLVKDELPYPAGDSQIPCEIPVALEIPVEETATLLEGPAEPEIPAGHEIPRLFDNLDASCKKSVSSEMPVEDEVVQTSTDDVDSIYGEEPTQEEDSDRKEKETATRQGMPPVDLTESLVETALSVKPEASVEPEPATESELLYACNLKFENPQVYNGLSSPEEHLASVEGPYSDDYLDSLFEGLTVPETSEECPAGEEELYSVDDLNSFLEGLTIPTILDPISEEYSAGEEEHYSIDDLNSLLESLTAPEIADILDPVATLQSSPEENSVREEDPYSDHELSRLFKKDSAVPENAIVTLLSSSEERSAREEVTSTGEEELHLDDGLNSLFDEEGLMVPEILDPVPEEYPTREEQPYPDDLSSLFEEGSAVPEIPDLTVTFPSSPEERSAGEKESSTIEVESYPEDDLNSLFDEESLTVPEIPDSIVTLPSSPGEHSTREEEPCLENDLSSLSRDGSAIPEIPDLTVTFPSSPEEHSAGEEVSSTGVEELFSDDDLNSLFKEGSTVSEVPDSIVTLPSSLEEHSAGEKESYSNDDLNSLFREGSAVLEIPDPTVTSPSSPTLKEHKDTGSAELYAEDTEKIVITSSKTDVVLFAVKPTLAAETESLDKYFTEEYDRPALKKDLLPRLPDFDDLGEWWSNQKFDTPSLSSPDMKPTECLGTKLNESGLTLLGDFKFSPLEVDFTNGFSDIDLGLSNENASCSAAVHEDTHVTGSKIGNFTPVNDKVGIQNLDDGLPLGFGYLPIYEPYEERFMTDKSSKVELFSSSNDEDVILPATRSSIPTVPDTPTARIGTPDLSHSPASPITGSSAPSTPAKPEFIRKCFAKGCRTFWSHSTEECYRTHPDMKPPEKKKPFWKSKKKSTHKSSEPSDGSSESPALT